MRHAQRQAGAEWEADERRATVDYRPARVEPCACGGFITADPSDSADVARAVAAHRLTWGHRAWRATLEGEG
jgi:hypothetical protein